MFALRTLNFLTMEIFVCCYQIHQNLFDDYEYIENTAVNTKNLFVLFD
jgi:hypothetical protein